MLAATERVDHFEVKALAFSPDGSVLAVGTNIGQVKLFNARSGELVRSLDDEKAKLADKTTPENWKSLRRAMGSVASLAFSPDGSLLATCGGSFDDFSSAFDVVSRLRELSTGPGRLKVWKVNSGTLQRDLVGHSHAAAVAFSPDGNSLASAGNWLTGDEHGTGVILWNLQTGAKIRTMTTEFNGSTHAVAFSPNGKLVVIGWRPFDKEDDANANSLSVFNALSGTVEWQKTFTGLAKPVAFMPNEPVVLVLCRGGFLWLAAEKGAAIWAAICPAGYDRGTQWNDFAIAPQGYRLAISGVTKDKQEFVEVVDFGGPPAAAHSTPAKDGTN